MKAQTLLTVLGILSLSGTALAAPHGMYPTRQQKQLNQLLATIPGAAPAADTKLIYFGGPVISNAKVYAVMWGKSVKAATQKQIGDFLSKIVDSTSMDWLSEYNTDIKAVDGRDGTNQKIGRGTYAGLITITPNHTGNHVDDKDIQAELDQQIDAKVLPAADANTLYMIYFPPGVSISIDGMNSCQAFCAYHEGFASATHGNVFYGVMPDLGGACAFGCGFHINSFDSLTNVSSHELTEAITDPFPTPADQPAFPQAWNTTDGQEIGDICAETSSKLTTQDKTYVIQGEFDNSIGDCRTGTYQSP